MFTIGKDVRLQRKKGASRIHQVDAGEMILLANFLRPQMLLDGHRVVGATLDGRVVGDDDASLAFDHPDACYDARGWSFSVVHVPRRQRVELQKWRIRVAQPLDALTGQQLVPRAMARDRSISATLAHLVRARSQLGQEFREVTLILGVRGAGAVYSTFYRGHSWISSRDSAPESGRPVHAAGSRGAGAARPSPAYHWPRPGGNCGPQASGAALPAVT